LPTFQQCKCSFRPSQSRHYHGDGLTTYPSFVLVSDISGQVTVASNSSSSASDPNASGNPSASVGNKQSSAAIIRVFVRRCIVDSSLGGDASLRTDAMMNYCMRFNGPTPGRSIQNPDEFHLPSLSNSTSTTDTFFPMIHEPCCVHHHFPGTRRRS
jgi:hypothetical protein